MSQHTNQISMFSPYAARMGYGHEWPLHFAHWLAAFDGRSGHWLGPHSSSSQDYGQYENVKEVRLISRFMAMVLLQEPCISSLLTILDSG